MKIIRIMSMMFFFSSSSLMRKVRKTVLRHHVSNVLFASAASSFSSSALRRNTRYCGTTGALPTAFIGSTSKRNNDLFNQPIQKRKLTSSNVLLHQNDILLRSRELASKSRFITTSSSSPTSVLSSSSDGEDDDNNTKEDHDSFFANINFETMGIKSSILLQRLRDNLHLTTPTSIQAESYGIVSDGKSNAIIGAETGTGKTLAYLLPIMDDIIQRKITMKQQQQQNNAGDEEWDYGSSMNSVGYQYARALILVPNKELVQQVVRMASILAGGDDSIVYPPSATGRTPPKNDNDNSNIVRIATMPGGLKEVDADYAPFRNYLSGKLLEPIDVIISTPASIGPLGLNIKNNPMFLDINTVIIDEADMLLDGGYLRPLQDVFLGFRRADKMVTRFGRASVDNDDSNDGVDDEYADQSLRNKKKTQYIFVAATLPDYGLRSVDAYLQKKFPNIIRINDSNNNMHNAKHYGLIQPTKWIYEPSRQGRMKSLVNMLSRPGKEESDEATAIGGGELLNEKVMVFLNSVDDVENASMALSRTGVVPLPYHAKMSLEDRTKILERFRQYNPARSSSVADNDTSPIVLVCTDLASRGLDIPGVTVVVQLEFATNVVAHLHRMGRCGRAGKRIGRGIIFYDNEKEGELVRVVQQAEMQQQQQQDKSSKNTGNSARMILQGDVIGDFDDDDSDDHQQGDSEADDVGKVGKAFSRKRGFTKKRKKLRKETETNRESD